MRLVVFMTATLLMIGTFKESVAKEWVTAVWPCFAPGSSPAPLQPGDALHNAAQKGIAHQSSDNEIIVYVYDSCDGQQPPAGQPACRVTYRKKDSTQTLWSANFDQSYCFPHAEKLASKLESAGYDCLPIDAPGVCVDVSEGDHHQIQSEDVTVSNELGEPGTIESLDAAIDNVGEEIGVETGKEVVAASGPEITDKIDEQERWLTEEYVPALLEYAEKFADLDARREIEGINQANDDPAKISNGMLWPPEIYKYNIDNDAAVELAVTSVYCPKGQCDMWIMDPGEDQLIPVIKVKGRLNRVASCIEFEGEERCFTGEYKPLISSSRETMFEQHWYVFEYTAGGYRLTERCYKKYDGNKWNGEWRSQDSTTAQPMTGRCDKLLLKKLWSRFSY